MRFTLQGIARRADLLSGACAAPSVGLATIQPVNIFRKPLRVAYRLLGSHYLSGMLLAQFQLTYLFVLAGVGLLTIYQPLSTQQFLTVLLFAEATVVVENVFALMIVRRLALPARMWLRGARSPEVAVDAWRALTGLPLDYLRRARYFPALLTVVPIACFIYLYLGLPQYALPILLAGCGLVLVYSGLVRFFGMELIARPVLEEISPALPGGVPPDAHGMTLRLKLLLGLPLINVVTGVVVAGLASRGHANIRDLGVDVLSAVGVGLTISLQLVLLASRSILEPIADMREATDHVARGDFAVRVPVISADEAGSLAGSFNRMVTGLAERERLHEAFGTYVDPELTERVLEEGSTLGGEEVEVTVLFLDIRDFTAFAERASAAEVVARLNDLYELVVPILRKHGGRANAFLGDGLLGVFGAPERLADHADRAVAAALETAQAVRRRYGEELRVGIGINSGPVVAGAIGGGGHLEFTVIGDAVNTASRVERVTRETGDAVLITEATRCLLKSEHGGFERRPTAELAGKTERVVLYSPVASDRVELWRPGPSKPRSSTAAD